jgi:hypothetical protein
MSATQILPRLATVDSRPAAPETTLAPLSPEQGFPAIVIYVAIVLAGCVYALLPQYGPPLFCPPGALACGALRSSGLLLYGLGLIFGSAAALFIAWRVRLPNTDRPPVDHRQRRKVAAMAAGCGLAASTVLWADFVRSYYCVTPQDIVLHHGVFASPRVLPWNEVEAVQGSCRKDKYGATAGLALSLSNGLQIDVALTSTPSQATIRSALAGRRYAYSLSNTVTPELCPDGVYQALTHWSL